MDQLQLLAFSAPDRPDLCQEFLREHELVLTELNIPLVVRGDDSWTRDAQCFVIVALHPIEGMVGGIRFQMDHGEGSRLPMAQAISKLDPRIHSALEDLKAIGNGEVCGLWSANRYANRGVTVLLSIAVTAIAPHAGAKSMVCFVGHHTKRHPERNGFIALTEVGDEGAFDYPTAEFKSIAMVNPDPVLLPHANMAQRRSIYSLRLRPEQTRVESPARIPLEVKYDLVISKGVIDLVAYRSIAEERLRHTA
ncbi:MAG: hypothetical protein JNM62_11410 [Flavobacteriales bacterium]|nr:hypothetical protein [Flavobacteriales bacterium]